MDSLLAQNLADVFKDNIANRSAQSTYTVRTRVVSGTGGVYGYTAETLTYGGWRTYSAEIQLTGNPRFRIEAGGRAASYDGTIHLSAQQESKGLQQLEDEFTLRNEVAWTEVQLVSGGFQQVVTEVTTLFRDEFAQTLTLGFRIPAPA